MVTAVELTYIIEVPLSLGRHQGNVHITSLKIIIFNEFFSRHGNIFFRVPVVINLYSSCYNDYYEEKAYQYNCQYLS